MHEYELTYITRVDVDVAKLKKLEERMNKAIEKHQATQLATEDLGEKRFAYPIHKEGRGHYYLMRISGAGDVVADVENHLRLNQDILRFLTVRVEQGSSSQQSKQEEKVA